MKKRILLTGLLFVISCAAFALTPLEWKVGYSAEKSKAPLKYVPSQVPGAVQLDIAKAEKYPPYEFADNYKMFAWMEDQFYTYLSKFKKPVLNESERLFFVSRGIDYQFEIFINEQPVHQQEGMFTYVEIDITDFLKDDNELKIIVFPVPKLVPFPVDRSQAAHVVKPAVSYEWDWHPRLVPLGIWDETGLEVRNRSHLTDIHVSYKLTDSFDKALIQLQGEGKNVKGLSYTWTLKDRDGNAVLTQKNKIADDLFTGDSIVFNNPVLWFPHDHGTPYLYTSTVELQDPSGKVVDTKTRKIGFKRVRLVMNTGAWIEPVDFPKSRSVPPAQFEVNGKRIFAKGSNWVNPEIFPGIITRERYAELIDLAVGLNFNMFRIWGGGIINKESFFELCDERGILVWEEFPLACNNYPDDPHYLKILRQEATSIIKRLRKHPCIALWCGGNELFNNWSGMTDQSLPLRLLNSLCLELDPAIPYNPTSPLMGMGHGCYLFKYLDGTEVYENMNKAHFTAYTEFGMPGMSPVEVLKKIIPAADLFPPRDHTAWRDHHAYGAWVGDTWLSLGDLESYFGKAPNLETLVQQSQLMQSEGYKAIYEEARRQKPYCAMALNWCYNEPWPAAVNNSIIVYPSIKKPAYDAISASCRPVLASARFSKFQWNEGEEFFADIYVLNDTFKEIPPLNLSVKLQSTKGEVVILKWESPVSISNTNVAGPTVRFRLPRWEETDRFNVILDVEGHPEYNSTYTLLYKPRFRPNRGTSTLNMN
jgi:beta-mannosidase